MDAHEGVLFGDESKKGDLFDFRLELTSGAPERVSLGLKKVLASHALGKDVVPLFGDISRLMTSHDAEQKKLCYLYFINVAPQCSEKLSALLTNIRADTKDRSPLVRALAIRTLSGFAHEGLRTTIADILLEAKKDNDPYVRKTIATCIGKFWTNQPDYATERGLLDAARLMINDVNPMVVANAINTLKEIQECLGKDLLRLESGLVSRLVLALGESNEWSLASILDALGTYQPSSKEASELCLRIQPHLKHSNAGVMLAAIKVIMKYLPVMDDQAVRDQLLKERLPAPLVTLLNEFPPEIKYVALRNISVCLQLQPDMVLDVRSFWCKYDDPSYVKLEKLKIITALAKNSNIGEVLIELKTYATEVDVDFVRQAVLAVGRCAIRLEQAAERCVKVLLDLIHESKRPGARSAGEVNYVVQEAIVVIRDIFRKYPGKYEVIISTLCEHLESLDEPDAKSSLIWIIGEYADRIDNAAQLLESFVEGWQSEATQVQLSLLTALAKLYLKRPAECQKLVQETLRLVTEKAENPDLRDRAFVYWRLLATDVATAQSIILAERPVISHEAFHIERSLLDQLLSSMASIASVYHKSAQTFVGSKLFLGREQDDRPGEEDDDDDPEQLPVTISEEDGDPGARAAAVGPSAVSKPTATRNVFDDIDLTTLDFGASAAAAKELPILLPAAQGAGLQLRGEWARRSNQLFLDLKFENKSSTAVSMFFTKFNANYVGITPATQHGAMNPGSIPPNGKSSFSLPIDVTPAISVVDHQLIQVALKSELGIVYFQVPIDASVMFEENGAMQDKKAYIQQFSSTIEESKAQVQVNSIVAPDTAKQRLNDIRVFFIASPKQNPAEPTKYLAYFSLRFKGEFVLVELITRDAAPKTVFELAAKSSVSTYAKIAVDSIALFLNRLGQ
jgi:AP-1 complex subunit beta-1